jgi:LPS-assembly protein
MSKGRSSVTFLGQLIAISAFFSFSIFGAELELGSAAEIDWRPAAAMSEEERKKLPYFCQGSYIQPILTPLAPGIASAEADAAYYKDGASLQLSGAVEVTQGTQTIQSPRINHNILTEIAEIDGPLQIREPGLLMTGEHATTNLFDGTGVIDQSTFLFHQSGFRGSSAIAEKDARGYILLDDASITRCEPTSNAWTMNSKSFEIRPADGYGVARNVTIRVKDIPIIYTPYLKFPIDQQRHSGFLVPYIGYDSDGGTDLQIPYYFNLAPDYDATYQLRSMWKRGIIHEGEFRHITKRSQNEINLGYINKDKIYDDRVYVSPSPGAPAQPIGELERQDRWLLSLRHEGGSDTRWKTSVNYSAVSDVDYLQDIGGNVATNVDQYINPVESSLTDIRAPALDRIGQVQYRGDAWNLGLKLQGFQNLNPKAAEQYERLPTVNAAWKDDSGPIKLRSKFEYTYFDKENTKLVGTRSGTIGERAVLDLKASLPLKSEWGFLTPRVGLIHRKYNLDDGPASFRSSPEITTPTFSVDTGLIFDRFFKLGDNNLQQTLEPRLFYLYVENDEQDDLPAFDASNPSQSYSSLFRINRFSGYDRIGDANQVGLGITSRLMSESTGAQLVKFSVGQIFYLADREVIFSPKRGENPTAETSPIFATASIALSNQFKLSTTYEWEPDTSNSNRGTIGMKYAAGQRKIFNLNYVYTSPELQRTSLTQGSEESDISFIWPIYKNWSAIGRWNFRWDDHRTIESFVGLEYNDCCWKTRLVARRFLKSPTTTINLIDDPSNPGNLIPTFDTTTPADTGIFFEFQLKGLATVGKGLDSLLETAIPGYRARENRIGL